MKHIRVLYHVLLDITFAFSVLERTYACNVKALLLSSFLFNLEFRVILANHNFNFHFHFITFSIFLVLSIFILGQLYRTSLLCVVSAVDITDDDDDDIQDDVYSALSSMVKLLPEFTWII